MLRRSIVLILASLAGVLASPSWSQARCAHLEGGGHVPVGNTPAEFRQFLEADLKKIAEIARIANVKPE